MNKIKSTKGITLISLVITIIVMLILVAVTISTAVNSGLFGHAQNATKQWANAQEQESNIGNDNQINDVVNQYTQGNGTGDETVPYVLAETMGGANSPDISGFNVENTYYVTWGTTAPYQPNETRTINNAPPSGWSNYNGREWANIKTTGGGNDCYWVWIPRYAYCITEGYHTNSANTIAIKFLQGTSNTPIDGSNITISNSSGSGNWNVHPAFWFDKNNNGVEDEGEQLRGIWVAKYEASSSNVNTINLENGELTGDTASLSGTGGGQNTNLQVRVKPNVTSWRGITVNSIFTVCQNLTKTVTIDGTQIKNSLADTTNLDSHMMKNTEWGAVAYLSRSVYGINNEVWNNPYYNNATNYSPITGLCGNASNGKDNGTTNISNTVRYNEVGGGNASTTGNVYGVYDMAGGAWEYVAGIYTGGASNDYRSLLWNSSNSKFVDQYTVTTDSTLNSQEKYYGNTNKYGDAVYETSSSGSSGTGSWDSSGSHFPISSTPVFKRGGHAGSGRGYAGVFAFSYGTGEANTDDSFRPVVLSSQP